MGIHWDIFCSLRMFIKVSLLSLPSFSLSSSFNTKSSSVLLTPFPYIGFGLCISKHQVYRTSSLNGWKLSAWVHTAEAREKGCDMNSAFCCKLRTAEGLKGPRYNTQEHGTSVTILPSPPRNKLKLFIDIDTLYCMGQNRCLLSILFYLFIHSSLHRPKR